MNPLGLERLTLQSPLHPDALAERFRARVEPLGAVHAGMPERRAFEGELVRDPDSERDTFRLVRLDPWARTLRPLVVGEVRPSRRGAVVECRLRPQWEQAALGGAVFGGLGGAAVELLGRVDPTALLPLGMMLAGYASAAVAYGLEAEQARAFLRELAG